MTALIDDIQSQLAASNSIYGRLIVTELSILSCNELAWPFVQSDLHSCDEYRDHFFVNYLSDTVANNFMILVPFALSDPIVCNL